MGRKILADAGYDVVTVNNGSAALKRITEIKPDLIVLDVYMPGYSGLEVCQRLKDADETAHIPVLLTVGKLEPFKPEEARRVRADAHIVKPFEASELLTAITRLEDRMVPQQSDGGRFSSSVSGVERFGGDGGGRKTEGDAEADTGWKSRLRFPSKKKKEEPEPEPEDIAAAAPFRDFRKGKGKTAASFKVKEPPPPGQEPGLVPDIPRDITPEELDALSALAAQLDGPIPAAEDLAPLAEKMEPVETSAAGIAPARTEPAKTEVEVPAAAAEAKQAEASQEETKEAKTPVPSAVEIVAPPVAAVAAPALVVEEKSERKREVEIPAGPPAEPVAAVAEVHEQPAEPSETAKPETPAAVVPVDAAVPAQQASIDIDIDKADEPRFASVAGAVEQAAEEKVAQDRETTELKPAAVAPLVVAPVVKTEPTEAVASAEVVVAKSPETKPEESEAHASRTEELKPEQPVEASASVQEAEEPAPSDADLVEALRLLTPATGQVDVSTIPSHGTLVAAGQLLAEEAARNAATGPRWMAEAVTLSSEEAAISLEAEMFRTFATMPAAALGSEPVPVRGVSAITAAVENRLAAAELAASAKTLPEQEAERASVKHVSEATASESSTVTAPAEALAAVSNAASPVVDEITPEITAEKIAPEKLEVEEKDSVAKVAEAMPAEEVASATFADAVGRDEAEVEATAEQNGEQVGGTKVAVAEENQDSNSDSGGEDAMGKDEKSKSGKSNWHQIHTAPANAAAQGDVVEAAKQAAQQGVEETPKTMAAAAAADGSKAAFPTDASSIASIVDSVMADLRPKIVEEIARKLAGK
jgi:CheY-like chemotaxis protein